MKIISAFLIMIPCLAFAGPSRKETAGRCLSQVVSATTSIASLNEGKELTARMAHFVESGPSESGPVEVWDVQFEGQDGRSPYRARILSDSCFIYEVSLAVGG